MFVILQVRSALIRHPALALTPPICPPQTSSSELNTLPASLSYSLLAQAPRPGTSISSPWNPAPNCLSISLRRLSSRRCFRNRDRSQSSHRRNGMVVPSNTAVLSSCAFDRISPSTRLLKVSKTLHDTWNCPHLVSPHEKSSKCQKEYTGRTKFQMGKATRYTIIHAT